MMKLLFFRGKRKGGREGERERCRGGEGDERGGGDDRRERKREGRRWEGVK